MDRDERLNRLLEAVGSRGRLSVHEAAAELEVSEATIRRDLDELASQQLLRRTRGGAAANSLAYDLPLRYKAVRRADEKQRIGLAAAKLVKAGDVVGLNGGTTAAEIGRALATNGDLDGDAFTVVTNSLNIAKDLAIRPQTKVVVTGGVCRAQSYELAGPLATPVLEQISLDLVFLGVDGLDAMLGATTHHEDEGSTNRLMALRSERVAIVTDSTKLGRRAFARICSPEEVDLLITDRDADPHVLDALRDAGIEVMLV